MSDIHASQRAAARAAETCSTTPSPVANAVVPGRRVIPDCEVPPAAPTPAFVTPQPAVTTPASLLLPQPIVLLNAEVSATCAALPGGGPVGAVSAVAAGTLSTSVFFQDIPNISANQLDFIARLPSGTFTTSSSVDVLISALHLDPSQAAILRATLDAEQLALNEQAHTLSLAGLDCYWINSEKTVHCPNGALGTGDATSAVNPSVIAAGQYQSKISQADADNQATAAAVAMLRCEWGNTDTEVTCLDAGFSEGVPTDDPTLPPPYPNVPRRVGSVVVPRNTFLSTVSAADASSQARAYGLSLLVCLYVNPAINLSCDAIGKVSTAPVAPADPAAGTSGNPVNIPAGFITSTVSNEDAAAQANALAQSMLDCHWTNDAQTATCPSEPATLPDGSTINIAATVLTLTPAQIAAGIVSPSLPVTIAAGSIISYDSKAAANEQAIALATAQLDCLYCNAEIAPVCTTGGSIDQMSGVPAGKYCAYTAQSAQDIAQSVANIPDGVKLAQSPTCTFGNDPQQAACVASADGSIVGLFPPGTAGFSPKSTQGVIHLAANTVIVSPPFPAGFTGPTAGKDYANSLAQDLIKSFLNCFFISDPQCWCCDAIASANPPVACQAAINPYLNNTAPFDTVWVGKDTYTYTDSACTKKLNGTPGNGITYVNGLPTNIGALSGYDTANTYASVAFDIIIQTGVARGPGGVYTGTLAGIHYTAGLPTNPIVSSVSNPGGTRLCGASAVGLATSYTSLAEANLLAKNIVTGSLVCAYQNNTAYDESTCPPHSTLVQAGHVGVGEVTSFASVDDANAQAKALAKSRMVCAPNSMVGSDGAPGNDGPQTNCQGQCFGFYS